MGSSGWLRYLPCHDHLIGAGHKMLSAFVLPGIPNSYHQAQRSNGLASEKWRVPL
jgi:hypothetical protein